jgi:glycosyltransferase involved in cell wall biosynthesis
VKLLFVSNIPSPYRIDFYNELGKYTDLTVIFEAKTAKGIRFNWNIHEIKNFKALFLKEGEIRENRIDWRIIKYLNVKKYDHIILTNYSYLTEMFALVILKLMKVPYFLEIDGGLIRKESNYKKKLKHLLISNAKGYFSPSKYADEYLKYYGVSEEKIFRYPFTSLKKEDILLKTLDKGAKTKLRESLNLKGDKIVLSIGRFIPLKGFDILLSSSRFLSENIEVLIIGGEPTEDFLRMKNKLELTNVNFLGFKTKNELKKYYLAADLFVLPTREDIWGLVVNEALSYGLPVITTDKCVAGLELVENNRNGFIIPVNNSEKLAEKITEIFKDDLKLEHMSYESLKKIKLYTIENMVKRHMKIFNKFSNRSSK